MTLLNTSPAKRANRHEVLLPAGWPKPKGYANGIVAEGRMVFIGGQIGWDATGAFPDSFPDQLRQTLQNVVDVLAEAGAGPESLVRMTWYVVDIDLYASDLKAVGTAYRDIMGSHYPAMALVQVVRLVEPLAQIEIEATAVLND